MVKTRNEANIKSWCKEFIGQDLQLINSQMLQELPGIFPILQGNLDARCFATWAVSFQFFSFRYSSSPDGVLKYSERRLLAMRFSHLI